VFRARVEQNRKNIIPLLLNKCRVPSELNGCHEPINWRNGDGGRELLAALNALQQPQTWIRRLARTLLGQSNKEYSTSKLLYSEQPITEGPVTISCTDVFEDILGQSKIRWEKTYPRAPSIDEVFSDLLLSHPFGNINDDVERSAYLSLKIYDALFSLIDSPSPTPLLLRFMSYLDIPEDTLKKGLMIEAGRRALDALRMNEVKSIRIEVRRGTVSHQLFFLYRPTSFALAKQTI
jgi:hypothetical protein